MNPPLASTIQAANSALLVSGNMDLIAQFFAPDYVVHLTGQDLVGGHETVRQAVGMLRRSFPALNCEVEILLEGDDRVAWQRTLRGTQKGAHKGFPARGVEIIWRDMVTSRFQNGVIAEEWVVTDLAERLLLAQKKTK